MNFQADLRMEENFYNKVFKKWLNKKGYDVIYVRYDDKNFIHQELQKKNDIDLILDTGKKNITCSLKTVRKVYDQIFFETISNTTINSKGWGYYSKADYIIYTFGYPDKIKSIRFRKDDIPFCKMDDYPKGYGQTVSDTGQLFYETEGRLIPLTEFKHKILFELGKP